MNNIFARIRELSSLIITAQHHEDWDLVDDLEGELAELERELEELEESQRGGHYDYQ